MNVTKGMVKNYSYYHFDGHCGGVAGSRSHSISNEKYLLVPCCEFVNVLDFRTLAKVCEFRPHSKKATATALAIISEQQSSLEVAIGYSDGSLYLCKNKKNSEAVQLWAHRLGIECLAFNERLNVLASGSRDKDIILWDVAEQRGYCKLRGHKDCVTHIEFMLDAGFLLSSSKDRTIRIWDTEKHYCFQTLPTGTEEVLAFKCIFDRFLITGEHGHLLVRELVPFEEVLKQNDLDAKDESNPKNEDLIDGLARFRFKELGILETSSKRKISQMIWSNGILLAHSSDRLLDVYSIDYSKYVKQRVMSLEANSSGEFGEIQLKNFIIKTSRIKSENKIQSVCLCEKNSAKRKTSPEYFVAISSSRANSIQIYNMTIKGDFPTLLNELNGQNQCKVLDVCSDGSMMITGDGSKVRVWNRKMGQNFRTIDCLHRVTSLSFVPSFNCALIGTENGNLCTLNIATKDLSEKSKKVHHESICTICLYSSGVGFVSVSIDGLCSMWTFKTDLSTDLFDMERSVSVGAPCTSAILSHNNQLFAVSMLDCTIKVVFFDSFKLHLLLYGHSAPVQCLDISHDDNLLVSGSADRTIRIWGLRFGDCHRSLVYHENTITSVQFEKESHCLFASSMDGNISRWNGDNFERLQTLECGHCAPVTCMKVTNNYVISSSFDRTLRCWQKSSDILVTELEREKEQREREEAEERKSKDNSDVVLPGQPLGEAGPVMFKSTSCLFWADKIIEALDEVQKFIETDAENQTMDVQLLDSVMNWIKKSKAGDLFSILPFCGPSRLRTLFLAIEHSLSNGRDVELCGKIVSFVSRLYANQIVRGTSSLVDQLRTVAKSCEDRLSDALEMLSFNECALQALNNRIGPKSYQIKSTLPTSNKRKNKPRLNRTSHCAKKQLKKV